ncbi:MAG TPA: zinc ABC transporter substrate-binding protein [Erysipelothrix sp.]
MKKFKITLLMVLALVLTACGSNTDKPEEGKDGDKINVVTSFTIIEDMTKRIGGDLVNVYNLVPSGTDPHEYEPLPNDIKAAEDADLLLYNGMNLEGGEHGWFFKLVHTTGQDEKRVFELNKGVEPMYLTHEDGKEEEINPHSFINPEVGIKMAENLRDALIAVDEDNKAVYEANAEQYISELKAISERYATVINSIPEERRILVTSEHAFQYMASEYGLREAYVWEVDTEELGTPEQIKSLVDLLREIQPPVMFMESNVDPRPLETVSKETGIPIFEEPIYSDEIGNIGEQVDTYVKFLEHNIRIIEKGLSQ